MNRRFAALMLVFAGFAIPRPAIAQHHYLCQVAQPMVSRDEHCVRVEYVTYSLSIAAPTPGLEVRFTCYPGPGVSHQDLSRDTIDFSEIANLNAANLGGLTVNVEKRRRGSWNASPDPSGDDGGFYLDKLNAVLDVSALQSRTRPPSDTVYSHRDLPRYDALVAATVECMIDNASRSMPPIRNLKIDVVGSDRYRKYSKLYRVKPAAERKRFNY